MVINDDVSVYITLYLLPPKLPSGFDNKLAVFPILSVKKFTVNEDRQFVPLQSEIGSPEHVFVFLAIPMSTRPECFRQSNLHLRVRVSNGSHVP